MYNMLVKSVINVRNVGVLLSNQLNYLTTVYCIGLCIMHFVIFVLLL